MNSQQMIFYILIIGYILYKQFQPREVRLDSKGKYILCIFGLYQILQAIQNGRFQFPPLTVMGLILTLVLLLIFEFRPVISGLKEESFLKKVPGPAYFYG